MEQQGIAAKASKRTADESMALRNIAMALNGTVIFQAGTGENERFLVFCPGNDAFPGSKNHRELLKRRLHTLKPYGGVIGFNDFSLQDRHFSINEGSRSKSTAHCIELDSHFAAALESVQRLAHVTPVVIPCDTLDSPLIGKTIEDYVNKGAAFVVPAYLNGMPEQEATPRKAKKATRVYPRETPSPVRNTPPPQEFVARIEAAEQKKTEANEQRIQAEQRKKFTQSFVAQPEGQKLSLFVPKDKDTELLYKGFLQEALKLTDAQRDAISPTPQKDPRYPLVRGMLQIALDTLGEGSAEEKMASLKAAFNIPAFNEGRPAALADIKTYKSTRANAQQHEQKETKR